MIGGSDMYFAKGEANLEHSLSIVTRRRQLIFVVTGHWQKRLQFGPWWWSGRGVCGFNCWTYCSIKPSLLKKLHLCRIKADQWLVQQCSCVHPFLKPTFMQWRWGLFVNFASSQKISKKPEKARKEIMAKGIMNWKYFNYYLSVLCLLLLRQLVTCHHQFQANDFVMAPFIHLASLSFVKMLVLPSSLPIGGLSNSSLQVNNWNVIEFLQSQ